MILGRIRCPQDEMSVPPTPPYSQWFLQAFKPHFYKACAGVEQILHLCTNTDSI